MDISELRTKGMTNEVFLATQREFVAMFSALARTVGTEHAVAIMERVMEAGAHDIEVAVDEEDRFQFDITYCVWLELARAFGVPDACRSNCYFDEVAFPLYYRSIGLEFTLQGSDGRRVTDEFCLTDCVCTHVCT